MKKATLTVAIISVLLLAGLSTVTTMKTVKNGQTTAQITEGLVEVSKLVDTKYQRHWFFFADVNSSGYAKEAVVRCYDGMISVTYSDGVTNVNSLFGSETFTGSHSVHIYGFGGTASWAGSVTDRDVSFGGFVLVCFV